MQKRAVSGVVTAVLLILLAIATVAVVWVVVQNLISSNAEIIELGLSTINLDIVSAQVVVNDLEVEIKRDSGKGELSKIRFILEDSSGSTETIDQQVTLSEQERKTITILSVDFTTVIPADITKIEILPIVTTSSGKDHFGKLGDDYTLGSGGTPPPVGSCGNGNIDTINLEVCETIPLDLNGETCVTQGFDSGTLDCASDCLSFDTSSCVNNDPSLVLHLPFDGDLLDATTNGNDGSCTDCPTLVLDHNNNVDSAYQFTGTNQITVPHDASYNINGPFTIAVWVRIDTGNVLGTGTILTKQNWQGYSIEKRSNAGFNFYLKSNNLASVTIPTSGQGDWYHVTATYDGAEMKLYVNGVLDGGPFALVTTPASTDPLLIGKGTGASGNTGPLQGSIDDIRIYNRALDAGEVATLYSTT
jgi:hypothetical protein